MAVGDRAGHRPALRRHCLQLVGIAYALSFGASVQSIATACTAHFGSADVVNITWVGTDPGGTSVRATIPAGLANRNRGTTFVASAGNAGPNAGTAGAPGSGYNVITVGALQNIGNVYNTVAAFSSRGPMPFQFPDGSSAWRGSAPRRRVLIRIRCPCRAPGRCCCCWAWAWAWAWAARRRRLGH